MKQSEVFEVLQNFAPISLSDRLCQMDNMYDNSGIILPLTSEVTGITFALDLTERSYEYAVKNGCNLIVTHHPAIYRPIKNLDGASALYKCALNGIGVISMHLNFDSANHGIDYYLSNGIGGTTVKIIDDLGDNTGYGRIAEIKNATAESIYETYKKEFKTDKVWLYGEKDRKINKYASFCGAGLNEKAVYDAVNGGCEMVISADIPHHVLLLALEKGLSVLSCTHYSSENYGLEKICGEIKEEIKNIKIYFFGDDRFL